MGAGRFMMEAHPDALSDVSMETSKALARWAIAKAIGRSLQLDPQESCPTCPSGPSVNDSLASTALTTEVAGTSASSSTRQDQPSIHREESDPERQVKGPNDRRPSRVFEPVLRPRQPGRPEGCNAPSGPSRRPSTLPSFPKGSTEASVLLALQNLDAKYREPLVAELLSMSRELRAAKDRALTQSRRNSQLQKEADDQAKLFQTLVDLQQQNQWFEERRRKVDDTNKLLLENEQMQIERLRMAAEDVAAARHRLEQPNEIKKVLVAKRQQMLDRIHVLEEELKHLDDLTEAKDTAAANARIHN